MKKQIIATILCVILSIVPGCEGSSRNTSDVSKSSSSVSNSKSAVQKVEEALNTSYKNFDVSETFLDNCKILYISTTTENDTNDFGNSISKLTFKPWFDYDYILINYAIDGSVVSSILCNISSSEVYLSSWNNPLSAESTNSESSNQTTDLDNNVQNTDSGSSVQNTDLEESATPIPSYGSNQYKVGVDIPAGEYVLIGESSYFAITSDANGSDIILNENFDNDYIVTLNDGEYFTLKRATAYPFEQYCSSDTIDTSQNSGMLKIGVNLPAGEYKLSSTNGGGYYCIYTDSRCSDIVANDNFDSSTYITVSDGQYLLFKRCTLQQ